MASEVNLDNLYGEFQKIISTSIVSDISSPNKRSTVWSMDTQTKLHYQEAQIQASAFGISHLAPLAPKKLKLKL